MRATIVLAAGLTVAAGCAGPSPSTPPAATWTLSPESEVKVDDPALLARMGKALDAAGQAGTDPSISKFQVRAATVVTHEGQDRIVVGGNTEYSVPEAIHGEVSVMNHATARFGADVARREVQFIAFYSESCGDSRGCGDCRDYMCAATEFKSLLWVCGNARDHTIRVRRFADGLLEEEQFPNVERGRIDLAAADVDRLVDEVRIALSGGVTLFHPPAQQTAAAALTSTGRIYRAAGADDAAFHYRYPVGGALQQAATERDYFIRAVLVTGSNGQWPRVSYRDRQYGFEASSFGASRGEPATALLLTDGNGRFKATTFETALPHPFSVARFNPGAIDAFLKRQGSEAK